MVPIRFERSGDQVVRRAPRWCIPVPVLVAAPLLVALLAGCKSRESRPETGVIVADDGATAVGSLAPDATFMDAKGKRYQLSSLYQDVTVVAFVEESCSAPSSKVDGFAAKLPENISIVEISTGLCTAHEHNLKTRAQDGHHLAVICDGKKQVSSLYGLPGPSGVFVLDRHGRVVAKGQLSQLDALCATATELAWKARQEHEELYGGG